MGLTDEQIEEIDEQRYQEKLVDKAIEDAKPEEESAGGEAGGEEETETEETGGEESGGEEGGEEEGGDLFAADDIEEKEPDAELLTSMDEPDLMPSLFEKDKLPVKAQSTLKKALYDQSRRKKRHDHMPDFLKMTSNYNDDAHDASFLKSMAKNPLKDAFKLESSNLENEMKTRLSQSMLSTLSKMTQKMQIASVNTSKVLLEEKEIDDDNDLFTNGED